MSSKVTFTEVPNPDLRPCIVTGGGHWFSDAAQPEGFVRACLTCGQKEKQRTYHHPGLDNQFSQPEHMALAPCPITIPETHMTPEQAIVALEELPTDDPEVQHMSADIILCQLLISLDHEDVVDRYKKMMRNWEYA